MAETKANPLAALNPLFDEPYGQESSDKQSSVTVVSPVTGKPIGIDPIDVASVAGGTGVLMGKKLENVTSRLAPPLPSRVDVSPSTVAPPSATAPSAPIDPKTGMPYSGDKWSGKVVGDMGPGGNSVTEAARNYRIQQGLTPTEAAQFKTNREGIILPNKTEMQQRMMQEAQQNAMTERAKRGAQTVGRGVQTATHMAPRVMTGLGLAGAGYEGTEAFNRFRSGDIPGGVISSVGALGSLASMAPHPLVRGAGTVAGVASPLALQGYDYLREKLR